MYMPEAFRETDLAAIQAFIRANNFGILVGQVDGAPFATHLPLLLDGERGNYGTLRGHVARANPHWQSFGEAHEALIIFPGPHAYISPSWYETALSVPTWNYEAVHAYGRPRIVDGDEELRALLHDLVDAQERTLPNPWQMEGLPDHYLHGMMRAVVGFELVITRLEAKRKLSQNRSAADRRGAAAGLESLDTPLSRQVAGLMRG